jgi:hypothetical protein
MRLVTAKLHEADGDVGVAQVLGHRPDDPGPVDGSLVALSRVSVL